MEDRDIGKAASVHACLTLCHELSERLTATENYFSACQRLSRTASRPAQPRGAGRSSRRRSPNWLKPIISSINCGQC